MSGTLPIQARIDADLKAAFVAKCAEMDLPQVLVITKGIQAFVDHGAWWLEEDEDD